MLCFLMYLIISVSSERVEVSTSKGLIIGEKHNGYSSFLGIPYSLVNSFKPFSKPLRLTDFKHDFRAIRNYTICPQIVNSMYQGTMQCLTLNIYVPHTLLTSLPVLVWFHGESFWHGHANEYRSIQLVKHDIIFVSVNFRLGPYGFICPKERSMPKNQGLKDQINALKWIQKNIEPFGGNRKQVTIAGSGYGGGYVDLHLYNKQDENLFDKAIIQSGSVNSPGFYVQPDSRYPSNIANVIKKSIRKSAKPKDVLPFLNKIAPHKLLDVAAQLDYELGVCKEKKFMTYGPFMTNLPAKMKRIKILVGYNSMEMIKMYAENNTDEFYEKSGDIILSVLEKSFKLDKVKLETITNLIKKFYFGDKAYGPNTVVNLAKAMSDFFVVNGVERSVNKFVKGGAVVYKYLFSYTGASKYKNISGAGAPQGEELKFLLDWRSPISGQEQKRISKNMVLMWANFVKFGNPTPEDYPIAWKPLHGDKRPYLNIDVRLKMMDESWNQNNAFWHLLWYNQKNNVL